jgi:hypothetical protein
LTLRLGCALVRYREQPVRDRLGILCRRACDKDAIVSCDCSKRTAERTFASGAVDLDRKRARLPRGSVDNDLRTATGDPHQQSADGRRKRSRATGDGAITLREKAVTRRRLHNAQFAQVARERRLRRFDAAAREALHQNGLIRWAFGFDDAKDVMLALGLARHGG